MHVKVESSGVNTSLDNRTTGRRWDDVMMEWMSRRAGASLVSLGEGWSFLLGSACVTLSISPPHTPSRSRMNHVLFEQG